MKNIFGREKERKKESAKLAKEKRFQKVKKNKKAKSVTFARACPKTLPPQIELIVETDKLIKKNF